ncbi:piggyBac transposable element-derived protein 3-like [Anoplophora glabripennis]|uniref:piggyBac transposable element-derived protein 3-like n=1 Tax=Anoplophora glabripennis TaxID=217634 RepID=UPI00087469B9|nr:piggyBac transposable element-derived protein 3-like [Anoplophora glabripennis]
MSRDRFAWLLGNVHLADNSVMPARDSPNYDKLYKVRFLLDILSETFRSSYAPSKHQSIDESMIRFKGRSFLKQFMPLKPIKRGYKVWVRSDENGYVCQFQIYVGKINYQPEKDLGQRVILDLTGTFSTLCHYRRHLKQNLLMHAAQSGLSEKMSQMTYNLTKNYRPEDNLTGGLAKMDWHL